MLNFFKKLFNIKSRVTRVLASFELGDGKVHQEEVKLDEFGERVTAILKQLHQPKAISEITFIYCLIGNIVEERFDNNLNKMVLGTKHFSPGTKVYCYPPLWGDGYEKIKVIGRHRKSIGLVTMIVPVERITNWRLKTVYNPFVIREMTNNFGWTDKESDKERINEMVQWLAK